MNRLGPSGCPEVTHFTGAEFINIKIGWLDIPMYDVSILAVSEGFANIDADLDDLWYT